jgi:TetR/AcrR family transcriptional repressor of mexJK operon
MAAPPRRRGAASRVPEPEFSADRSARKRHDVLDAATTLFLEQGYLGTSMDQIAALARVSKPTVYKFFVDKESLLSYIVLGTLERAGRPFRTELAALADTSDLDADLRLLARSYLATVMQPAVLRLRRLVIGASPQVPDLARAYYERAPEQTIAALADCMAALAARGLLLAGDPQSAAAHFAFLVIGRALDKSLFCGDRPFSVRELNAQADAGVTAFLAAYGQPADGQPARRQPADG